MQFGGLPKLMAQEIGGQLGLEALQIHFVHQPYPFLDPDVLLSVTHALVISCLDYCNMFYVGLFLRLPEITISPLGLATLLFYFLTYFLIKLMKMMNTSENGVGKWWSIKGEDRCVR